MRVCRSECLYGRVGRCVEIGQSTGQVFPDFVLGSGIGIALNPIGIPSQIGINAWYRLSINLNSCRNCLIHEQCLAVSSD